MRCLKSCTVVRLEEERVKHSSICQSFVSSITSLASKGSSFVVPILNWKLKLFSDHMRKVSIRELVANTMLRKNVGSGPLAPSCSLDILSMTETFESMIPQNTILLSSTSLHRSRSISICIFSHGVVHPTVTYPLSYVVEPILAT